jgi:hypothetical protein
MARHNKTGLTPAVIQELLNQGNTRSDIARMHGVSRQYINWIETNYGGVSKTPRQATKDSFPYETGGGYHGSIIERLLRHHLEYMATGGKGMSRDKLQRLRSFYTKLQRDNTVVVFDPEILPSEGNKFGGFAYVGRLDTDEGLIIRVNQYTKPLSPEDKELWRMPPRIPSPSMPN